MTGVIDNIFNVFMGLFDSLAKNALAIIILGAIALAIYLHYGKPKPIDMSEVVFKKFWDATTERLRMPAPKKLALCSYPLSVAELRETVNQVHYTPVGDIVGVNIVGTLTDVKELVKFKDNISNEELNKIINENQEAIENSKFWFVFACQQTMGGKFLFKTVRKTLIFVKPNQIIDMNSNDQVIRIRGYGLMPLGQYEVVNDENININRKQLFADTWRIINDEVTLAAWGAMGETVKEAMKSDSYFRKRAAEEGSKGIQMLAPAQGQKAET